MPLNHAETGMLRELARAIEAASGRVVARQATRVHRADLVFKLKKKTYVVQCKQSRDSRLEHIQGLLASALLGSRRAAHAMGGLPLPILGVERLTDRTLASLEKYVGEVAPGVAWGVIDQHGRRNFSRGELELLNAPGKVRARAERGAAAKFELFTDLGQWMAKVLLASRLPQETISAPRGLVRNARHLSLVAGVSAPTAARWVQHMKRNGFIEERDDGLCVVRRRMFFDSWRRALGRPRREVGAHFLLSTGDANRKLNFNLSRYAGDATREFDPDDPPPSASAIRWKRGPRACLGMFEAAAAHGIPFVYGAPLHLYLETISDVTLRMFDLAVSRRGERSQVVVVQPRFPESTFRAAVMAQRRDGSKLPACDILQTWLEIGEHPARGRENADEIERTIISPWLLTNDALDSAR